jgi:excisionase family DNA binding protein
MARKSRVRKLFPIARSVESACECLDGIHHSYVRAAVRSGALPVYRLGTKRRVLVADLIAWVRTEWKRDNP